MTDTTDWKFRADYFEERARYYDNQAAVMKAEADRFRVAAAHARDVDLMLRQADTTAAKAGDGEGA